jgi:hypothetical protein
MLVNLIKLETLYVNTNYAIEEFAKIDIETEPGADVNVVHSDFENGLITIDRLKSILFVIDEDATHIDIVHNCDHGEYEISLFKLEIPKPEDEEEFYKERDRVNSKEQRIRELEMELRQLRNEIISLTSFDDLPF